MYKNGNTYSFSRSGFTSWAVEIARKKELTMIGRLRGKRMSILSGKFRLKMKIN